MLAEWSLRKHRLSALRLLFHLKHFKNIHPVTVKQNKGEEENKANRKKIIEKDLVSVAGYSE